MEMTLQRESLDGFTLEEQREMLLQFCNDYISDEVKTGLNLAVESLVVDQNSVEFVSYVKE